MCAWYYSNNYPTSVWSASQSVLAVSKTPTGSANRRQAEALILYLINTFNEILIAVRHATTLSILLGFSQEENDVLAAHNVCQIRCSGVTFKR